MRYEITGFSIVNKMKRVVLSGYLNYIQRKWQRKWSAWIAKISITVSSFHEMKSSNSSRKISRVPEIFLILNSDSHIIKLRYDVRSL